jgi:hypothetical protein
LTEPTYGIWQWHYAKKALRYFDWDPEEVDYPSAYLGPLPASPASIMGEMDVCSAGDDMAHMAGKPWPELQGPPDTDGIEGRLNLLRQKGYRKALFWKRDSFTGDDKTAMGDDTNLVPWNYSKEQLKRIGDYIKKL